MEANIAPLKSRCYRSEVESGRNRGGPRTPGDRRKREVALFLLLMSYAVGVTIMVAWLVGALKGIGYFSYKFIGVAP